MPAFTYLWEFTVVPGQQARFTELYGPDGAWVRLFRTAPGYLGTSLLQAHDRPGCYLTVDRWVTEEAYRRFRRERAADFEAIDAQGAGLTVNERLLGEYTEQA